MALEEAPNPISFDVLLDTGNIGSSNSHNWKTLKWEDLNFGEGYESIVILIKTSDVKGNDFQAFDNVFLGNLNAENTPALEINTAPIATSDSISIQEGNTAKINVLENDSDPENDVLTVINLGPANHGIISINSDDTINYTPDVDFTGNDMFTYTISDGEFSVTGMVTVKVNAKVVEPPINQEEPTVLLILIDSILNLELRGINSGDVINLSEANKLTIKAVPSESVAQVQFKLDGPISITQTERNAPYALAGDNAGNYKSINFVPGSYQLETVLYNSSNTIEGSVTTTFTIVEKEPIVPVNITPVANPDTISLDQDSSVTIDVLVNDTDADGDSLSISSIGSAGNGAVIINDNNTVTYTPNTGYYGADSFNYVVSDGTDSATGTVAVTINEVMIDEIPSEVISILKINVGGSKYIDNLGNTWIADEFFNSGRKYTNSKLEINQTNDDNLYQSERFAPNLGYSIPVENGNYQVKLHFAEIYFDNLNQRVFDISLESNLVEADLDLVLATGAKAEALVLSYEDISVNDSELNIDMLASINNAKLSAIEILSSDNNTEEPIGEPVIPVNSVPVVNPDTASLDQDSSVTIDVLVNDIDADGDSLSISSIGSAVNGTVIINDDNTITYTPNTDYHGTDSFNYVVSDSMDTSTGTVNIKVNEVVVVDDSSNISLVLIDSNSNTQLRMINSGDQVSLSEGAGLNMKAIPSETVAQVQFKLNGPTSLSRTEKMAPYALAGDIGGNYNSVNLAPGLYGLEIILYSNPSTVIDSTVIEFTVVP